MANFQLQDVQKVPYVVTELDADGNVATPGAGDTCAVTSDDTTKATIVPDATPSVTGAIQTGFVVGGSTLGTVNITSTITHADGTPGPSPVTDAIDILSGPPATQGFALGTPVNQ